MCGRIVLGSHDCDDTAGLTTKQMQTKESYTDWDFENVWAIDPDKNDGYPYLRWQTSFVMFDEAVDDTTPPVVTLIGPHIISLTVGDEYEEPGTKAVDDVDAKLPVTISGTVDSTTIGEYKLTYSATDSAGNVGTTMRVVLITEAETLQAGQVGRQSRMSNPSLPTGAVLGVQAPVQTSLEFQLHVVQMRLITLLLQYIEQLTLQLVIR